MSLVLSIKSIFIIGSHYKYCQLEPTLVEHRAYAKMKWKKTLKRIVLRLTNTLAYFAKSVSNEERKFNGINICSSLELSHFIQQLTSGLYYKPMSIVNDDSRFINKLETSLTDEARVVIYNRHLFIVHATERTIQIILEGKF